MEGLRTGSPQAEVLRVSPACAIEKEVGLRATADRE